MEPLHVLLGNSCLLLVADKALFENLGQSYHHRIDPDGGAEEQSLVPAVFRDEAHARRNGVSGRADAPLLSVDVNLAADHWVHAEDHPHGLRSARADQAVEAQHLAPMGLEADALDPGIVIYNVLDLQGHFPDGVRPLGVLLGQLPANHHGDHLILGDVADVPFADVAAIP